MLRLPAKLLFWVLLPALGGAAAGIACAEPLTLETARTIVSVRSPQISPDGKRVVYVRTVSNFKADSNDTTLMLADVTGTAPPRALTHDRIGIGEARWSPSGDRIAYTAAPEKGKPPQLYVLRMDGGDSQKVTDAKTGVTAFEWRPRADAFAYVSEDEAPNKAAIAKHDDAFYVTDEHFLVRAKAQPQHIWTIDADGKNVKRITSGSWSVAGGVRWSPDGGALLYQRQPDAIFAHFTKQYTIVHDMANGSERTLLDSNPNTDGVMSPDGTKFFAQVPRHGSVYLTNDLTVRKADGSALGSTVALDRNVHWAEWMPDSATIAVGTADGIRNVLWLQPVDGIARKVDLGDVDFGADATIARDGTIAFVGESRVRPREIFVLPPGAAPRRITDENAALAKLDAAPSQLVEWTTDDGMRADGVLTTPARMDAGKKYPLVLIIHGGPVATSTWQFSSLPQILAGRGYLVFQPNYRGSDNLGDAYLQAIVGHVTSGPGRDNLLGVAAVRKLGIVDDARIGVSGWSGGGLQTSWLVGHSRIFKAAVSGAAVNDWYEQAVLADINEEFAATFIPGVSPFTRDGRAVYRAESPITYARAIATPLLILSDTGDQRVPITQSFALYHALADRGATVKFIGFPRSGHFPTDPVGREAVFKAWAGWFDRWLK